MASISRNQREGRYVGTWEGKRVRHRGQLVITGFAPFWPTVDSALVWVVLNRRLPDGEVLLPSRRRYMSKADRAKVAGC